MPENAPWRVYGKARFGNDLINVRVLKDGKVIESWQHEPRLGTLVFERIIPSDCQKEGGTRKPCDGLCLIGLMCGLCGAYCVTCAHIVLHVRFVRCTLCFMCGLRGSHVLRVRFYASRVLYHNKLFGTVKI